MIIADAKGRDMGEEYTKAVIRLLGAAMTPHPEKLLKKMRDLDEEKYGGSADLRFGGDGDNGEHLLTLMRGVLWK